MSTVIDIHVKNDPKRGQKVRAIEKGQHLGKGSFNGRDGSGKAGDPYKFSATKGDLIVSYMFICQNLGFVARAAGINRETLRRWLKQAADDQKHLRVTALSVWKDRLDENMGKAVIDTWQDLRKASKRGIVAASVDLLNRIDAMTELLGDDDNNAQTGDELRPLTTEKQTQRIQDFLALARARQGKKPDDSE